MGSRILIVDRKGDWVPPDGLDRCRPREVRLTPEGKGLIVLACLLLAGGLAGGIALGLLANRQAGEARLLREESVVTEGTVTRLWRGGDNNRQRWMAYSYLVDGQAYGRRVKVSSATWARLKVGTRIPVHYVPSRPDLNYPLQSPRSPLPLWVPFAVALGAAAVSLLLVLHVRGEARLLAEGRAAPGQVTRLSKRHRSSHGTDLGQKVFYEFKLLSGAVAHGRAGPIKNPPEAGSTITVVYDPEAPRHNSPYPFSLVTPVNRRTLR